MKSFLVGLLVLAVVGMLCVAGIFLFPLLLVLGFFLRWILGFVLIIFMVWLIGKVTLISIDSLKRAEQRRKKRERRTDSV